MAPPAGSLRVGRYFLALALLLVVLYVVAMFPGKSKVPKLGLDLVGGAQVVLQASTTNGTPPSPTSMNEARSIIQQRVNGRGVSNSEVAIEGNNRITVTVPGKRAGDIANIGQTALLQFRPVLAGPFQAAAAAPTTGATPLPGGLPSPSGAPTGSTATAAPPSGAVSAAPAPSSSGVRTQGQAAKPLAAGTPTPTATPTATGTPTPSPGTAAPAATGTPAPNSAAAQVTPAEIAAFRQQSAGVPGASTLTDQQVAQLISFKCGTKPTGGPTVPIVTCDTAGTSKYLLSPVLFPGTEVADATAQAPGSQNVQWTVSLTLKSTGQRIWSQYTAQHNNPSTTGTDPVAADYVAFTLDGVVISAPHINGAITTPQTQISGSFTQASATSLANSLKYGALPLSFTELTSQTVSATLGSSQLKSGLLAGGIGLALVVLYSLLYYRALGLVTLASLLVSGAIIYPLLVLLGRQIGFTLTLAGIAGFIVAVGITADSFVVFFERMKDEVREGRSMRVAVPRAWSRARRTVLSADFVSLLAAVVLYILAAGDVRGFAFTLGLSTVIDVIVVFWFTHPVVSLLSRRRRFGSGRMTGLDAIRVSPLAVTAGAAGPSVAPKQPTTGSGGASTPPNRQPVTTGPVAVLDHPQDDELDSDAASEPAGRRGPPPGSAAERAAARRARLRSEREAGR